MSYDNTDILFQSLVGSQIDVPRFSAVQNELMKHVLPPIPFLPIKNKKGIAKPESDINEFDNWRADQPLPASEQFFPFSFELPDGKRYLLPYEPMVSISGKNIIVRRSVAKTSTQASKHFKGTIKERWSEDDYEITITGVLIGSIMTGDVSQCYPREDFLKLKAAMTAPQRLKVFCEPLQLLDINYIVIEEFSFPFTKGENVQAYSIKAYSDFDHKLLLDIND